MSQNQKNDPQALIKVLSGLDSPDASARSDGQAETGCRTLALHSSCVPCSGDVLEYLSHYSRTMKKIFCVALALALLCASALAEVGLASFSTTDMEGHAVTQDIFSDYDLTVVNIWATWCGYCIEEMPSFSVLKTSLPDNVNFITLCQDASDNMQLVGEILRTSGANFQTLVSNAEIEEQLLSQVYAFPTTYFLDSQGLAVTDPIVGVPSLDDPAGAYYELAMGVLSQLEAKQ